MNDLELYGGLYLAVGLVTSVVMMVSNWHAFHRDPNSLLAMMEQMDPQTHTRWYQFRARVLVPVLTAIAVAAFWPALPWMKFTSWCRECLKERQRRARIFRVLKKHLVERLTIEQAEASEMVTDPLNAVPPLPFGHLNEAWRGLIEQKALDDELWSFAAAWKGEWAQREWREGYVLVRRGRPIHFMLTQHVALRDEPRAPKAKRKRPLADQDFDFEIPAFLRKQAD